MGQLDALTSQVVAHFTRCPNQRTSLGLVEDVARLPPGDVAWRQQGIEEGKTLLKAAEEVDRASLSFDEDLDLDLAILKLKGELREWTQQLNGADEVAQKPAAADDIGDPLFEIATNDPRPDAARLADITGRLQDVPRYLRAHQATLHQPVARWRDIDLQGVQGLPEFFGNLVEWAKEVDFAGVEDLTTAAQEASAALKSYGEHLAAMPTTDALHLSKADAETIVEHKALGMGLDDLHQVAREFLARTRAETETLRQRIAPRVGLAGDCTADELTKVLAAKYQALSDDKPPEAVLDVYREEHQHVLQFIKDRGLFPVPDEQELKIIATPEFMRPSIPAGAMSSPPPLREGVRRSLIFLTLSKELMAEHTQLSIPMMMVHEGIPGHHLQLATATMHDSPFRRMGNHMEHAEGWTTMLEDYMLDQGYRPELSDEIRFVTKRDISRIGARVAIDLFFMTGDRGFLDVGVDVETSDPDPFVAAGALLKKVTGFVDGRCQAELNWYSKERGYPLSYLAGNTLVWQLKRDLEAKNGAGIELDRKFHQIYLESGNMPVTMLRRVFEHQGML